MHHTSGTKTQILTFIPKPLSGRNKKGTEGPPCAVGIPRSCPPRPRATVPGCTTVAAREPWRPTRLLIAMATDHASVANPLACLPFGAHVFHRLSTGLQCPRWQLPFAWRPLPCKWQSACTGFPGCGHRREDYPPRPHSSGPCVRRHQIGRRLHGYSSTVHWNRGNRRDETE